MDEATMTTEITTLMLLIIAILPLTGISLALVPYLVKKGEVFAVTVPESSASDPFIRKLKLRYLLLTLGLTAVLTLLALAALQAGDELGAVLCMGVGAVVLCVGSFALMLFFRKKVRTYKVEQGWVAEYQERTAVVRGMRIPRPVSLAWNLLYLPIIAATAAIGYHGYAAMPEMIPMQMGLDGEFTSEVAKSTLVIWLPVAIQFFSALCFVSSHFIITRSKWLSDPGAPAASALAYGMFAHAQSIYLVAGGLMLVATMVMMPLTFMGVMTMMQAAVFLTLAAVILAIGAVIIGVVYGQGGARVFKRMQESSVLLADDDTHWKLGVFYFNPNDPNWFLPARFGIGWTCNFARPFVWVLIAALVAVTIAFIVVMLALT
ncbi:MAG: DUF5808 domain-containing protein [Coriobacteriia bacterium]|nr:DUF5808 domain-containing protein [Coriobacteriia bacterium]